MDSAEPVGFSASDANLEMALDNLDGASNYANWIFTLLRPHVGNHVLEVGAGHGTFTERLTEVSSHVVAGDISPRCAQTLRERFRDVDGVRVYEGDLTAARPEGPFDTAVLINVLEHIPDDNEALRDILSLLEPGGTLLLWVPAFQMLYSKFDRQVGHHRRYRRSQLKQQLIDAGYQVTDSRYVNIVGVPAWLILAKLLGRTPTASGLLSIYDKFFVPVLQRIESRVPIPFGQSVFAVAVKPG
jgi:SAM-dependent methyltransferase